MTSSETLINLDQSDPVPLDPIILSARDELLEKYSDKNIDRMLKLYGKEISEFGYGFE